MSDGETTDDGCESPILCVSRAAKYAVNAVKYTAPPPAPSTPSPAPSPAKWTALIPGPARGHVGNYGRADTPQTLGHCDNRPEEAGSTEGDEADEADDAARAETSSTRRAGASTARH